MGSYNHKISDQSPIKFNPVTREMEGSSGSNLPEVSASDNGKTLQVVSGEWSTGVKGLPAVTSDDNNKTLQVIEGEWTTGVKGLPAVTSDDTGTILQVISGAWHEGDKMPYNLSIDDNDKILKVDTYNGGYVLGEIPSNYSDSEILVGHWIDGRPVYQQTLYYSSIGSGNNQQLLMSEYTSQLGLPIVIDIKGIALYRNNVQNFTQSKKIPFADGGLYMNIETAKSGSNLGVNIVSNQSMSGFEGYVTVQYIFPESE